MIWYNNRSCNITYHSWFQLWETYTDSFGLCLGTLAVEAVARSRRPRWWFLGDLFFSCFIMHSHVFWEEEISKKYNIFLHGLLSSCVFFLTADIGVFFMIAALFVAKSVIANTDSENNRTSSSETDQGGRHAEGEARRPFEGRVLVQYFGVWENFLWVKKFSAHSKLWRRKSIKIWGTCILKYIGVAESSRLRRILTPSAKDGGHHSEK